MSTTITCIALDGFKRQDLTLRRYVMITPGQELALPQAEYDDLAGRGLVRRPEDLIQEATEAHKVHEAEVARQQEATQAEWNQRLAERVERRKQMDEAAAQGEADRLQQAAERVRSKRPKLTS